ncbi:MAG: hypothetical protein EAZ36_01735 [Verrucomicrobia bacterium]|nr:MAG: hypothetical protein EAZ36_01735 [Verrucomicrobiota bacterium]
MKPAPRRRPRPSAFARAARLAPATLTLLLVLPACSSIGRRGKDNASAQASPAPIYVVPLHVELGRVLSYDAKTGSALVEFIPFAKIPTPLAGQALIARHPETLEQTARLIASAHRTGSVFGAYVVEGTPSSNDEVVIPPAL